MTADSIELRLARHWVECDWGRFGSAPLITYHYDTDTVTVENVAPLILISRGFVDHYNACPVSTSTSKSTVYNNGDRRFIRIDADNGTWTWELFPAHWQDREPCTVYVGRWPD